MEYLLIYNIEVFCSSQDAWDKYMMRINVPLWAEDIAMLKGKVHHPSK